MLSFTRNPTVLHDYTRPLQPLNKLNIWLQAQRARMRAARQGSKSLTLWAGRLTPRPFCARFSKDSLFIAAYALVLIAAAWATPLRVPEIVAIAWSANYRWTGFWHWASQALDPSPLGYWIQFPFVLLFGASRLGART